MDEFDALVNEARKLRVLIIASADGNAAQNQLNRVMLKLGYWTMQHADTIKRWEQEDKRARWHGTGTYNHPG